MPYPNLVSPLASVIILVADGARPDTLDAALRDGKLPALSALSQQGARHAVTTVFPSVTGPAYVPFLMGKHPGSVGLPGLRWFDRSRTVCSWPSYARSYVGFEMQYVDGDLELESPTMFELASSSVGALSVIQRGLPKEHRVARGGKFIARTAVTHFRGNVDGWLDIDRDIGAEVVRMVRDVRPAFTFAAFTGTDKTSHAAGHDAPIVIDALKIVDDVVAEIRTDAERGGYWNDTHLWIVSDHGHSPVIHHDDLAGLFISLGFRVLAHPQVFVHHPDVAVMVSGNAMAHIYLDLEQPTRPFWPALRGRWDATLTTLLERASVDVMIVPTGEGCCDIRTRDRGSATLEWTPLRDRYRYQPKTGDPLAIGGQDDIDTETAYAVTSGSDYPDALVQIAHLCDSPRCGDIIVSAARQWDFRAKYEPIVHVSSHGALHREHMLAPMITNRAYTRAPKRTIDVMPSAAKLLGIDVRNVEGESFV